MIQWMGHFEYGVGVCARGRGHSMKRHGHNNGFLFLGREINAWRKMNGGIWQKGGSKGH